MQLFTVSTFWVPRHVTYSGEFCQTKCLLSHLFLLLIMMSISSKTAGGGGGGGGEVENFFCSG